MPRCFGVFFNLPFYFPKARTYFSSELIFNRQSLFMVIRFCSPCSSSSSSRTKDFHVYSSIYMYIFILYYSPYRPYQNIGNLASHFKDPPRLGSKMKEELRRTKKRAAAAAAATGRHTESRMSYGQWQCKRAIYIVVVALVLVVVVVVVESLFYSLAETLFQHYIYIRRKKNSRGPIVTARH